MTVALDVFSPVLLEFFKMSLTFKRTDGNGAECFFKYCAEMPVSLKKGIMFTSWIIFSSLRAYNYFCITFYFIRNFTYPMVGVQGYCCISSHSETPPHSVELPWTSDRPVATPKKNTYATSGNRNRDLINRAAADLHVGPLIFFPHCLGFALLSLLYNTHNTNIHAPGAIQTPQSQQAIGRRPSP
jgi:hypothetical protein